MFRVGQEVVRIKDHPEHQINGVKGGNTYVVLAVRNGCCGQEIDIGLNIIALRSVCQYCGKSELTYDSTWWFSAKGFAPAEKSYGEMVIEKITEQIKEKEPLLV